MSTASADTSSDQPQRTSHQPGPLAILTATAIGSVIASRMGKAAPLVLAAGAAAFALLKQKKPAAPPAAPQPLPPTAPQPESPAQSQVEEWLSRQITREEQAPVIEFPAASVTLPEPEDDYRPQSFLLDDAEETPAISSTDDSFAQLTDPVAWHAPTSVPETVLETEVEPDPPVLQAPETPIPAPPPEDASWTFGFEPLPSLTEVAPLATQASSMFFSAPVGQENFESPPVIAAPIFEGAAFPDEINVIPAIEPVAHLTPTPPEAPAPKLDPVEPVSMSEPEPPPAVETTAETPPEIAVHLAAPGEASFDPPLAASPQNPWEPESGVSAAPYVSPFHTHSTSSVVEAEIILRPRAPMQNTVTTKTKASPHAPIKKDFAESFDSPPADSASDALFPSPLQSPQEPRARPTWRSWWRGD